MIALIPYCHIAGGGQLSAADVIAAMLQGFHNHLSQNVSTVLKLAYIVVHEDKILQEFLQGLKKWSIPRLVRKIILTF